MDQAGCTDKFSCAELPYVPSAVAVGAVSAPRQDWDWALCRELAGQERGWSLKNSDVLSQVPCGTVSRQLLWVGRKLPWVVFFFFKCINFVSKAQEIFACTSLLPPLFIIFIQQSWFLKTISALWRGTESYTGNARYWDISFPLHNLWTMVYYNKFVSTPKLVQWIS